jgi:uncharacterized coiled-coil DUF342 family protein
LDNKTHEDKAEKGSPIAHGEKRDSDEKASLNTLIKESNNPAAMELKKEIDDLRKERSRLIIRVKDSRRRLSYKEAEEAAIGTLLKMKKDEDKDGSKRKRVGYLRRMKQKFEFRISTEASSLSQEKEIIRKINEINQELDEALTSVRLERKLGFIKSDIESYRKSITEVNSKIEQLDAKLDGLYTNLRKTLGIGSWQNRQKAPEKKKIQQMQIPGINLEDIAVIKKKSEK